MEPSNWSLKGNKNKAEDFRKFMVCGNFVICRDSYLLNIVLILLRMFVL